MRFLTAPIASILTSPTSSAFEPFGLYHAHRDIRGSSSRDDRASLEHGSLSDRSNDLLDTKPQIVCVGIVSSFAVDVGLAHL